MFGFKLENFGNKIEHFAAVEWRIFVESNKWFADEI